MRLKSVSIFFICSFNDFLSTYQAFREGFFRRKPRPYGLGSSPFNSCCICLEGAPAGLPVASLTIHPVRAFLIRSVTMYFIFWCCFRYSSAVCPWFSSSVYSWFSFSVSFYSPFAFAFTAGGGIFATRGAFNLGGTRIGRGVGKGLGVTPPSIGLVIVICVAGTACLLFFRAGVFIGFRGGGVGGKIAQNNSGSNRLSSSISVFF